MKAALLGVIVVFLAGIALVAQQATFSAKTEMVRVDVLVSENGQPVAGLTPADFEVRDNGVLQQVTLATLEQLPLTVVLALDTSASVAGERLGHLRAAGDALLGRLKKDDQAVLVTFSHAVVRRAPLTGDIGLVRAAMARVAGYGETSLVDGAYAGLTLAQPAAGRSLLIVFSDGVDTSSFLTPDPVVETAKRSDVVVYSVSVGGDEDRFLSTLCDATGGRALRLETASKLDETFVRVLDEFRNRYLLSYSAQGVSREGWHRLGVRVKGRRLTVKARPGYWGR